MRTKQTRDLIVRVDRIVFVALDAEGQPTPHKKAGMSVEEAANAANAESRLAS